MQNKMILHQHDLQKRYKDMGLNVSFENYLISRKLPSVDSVENLSHKYLVDMRKSAIEIIEKTNSLEKVNYGKYDVFEKIYSIFCDVLPNFEEKLGNDIFYKTTCETMGAINLVQDYNSLSVQLQFSDANRIYKELKNRYSQFKKILAKKLGFRNEYYNFKVHLHNGNILLLCTLIHYNDLNEYNQYKFISDYYKYFSTPNYDGNRTVSVSLGNNILTNNLKVIDLYKYKYLHIHGSDSDNIYQHIVTSLKYFNTSIEIFKINKDTMYSDFLKFYRDNESNKSIVVGNFSTLSTDNQQRIYKMINSRKNMMCIFKDIDVTNFKNKNIVNIYGSHSDYEFINNNPNTDISEYLVDLTKNPISICSIPSNNGEDTEYVQLRVD